MNFNKKKVNYILKKVSKPMNKVLKKDILTTADILWVCSKIEPILQNEPNLLEIKPPVNIVGDIHGQLNDLLEVFKRGGKPSSNKYLFLGDYVDRGNESVEVLIRLFCLKLKYPQNIFLLRGNHETEGLSSVDGFYKEIRQKGFDNTWFTFNALFKCMSLAAVVGKRIFCVHGGISEELKSLSQIQAIEKPYDIPLSGMINDIVWSDPCNKQGFVMNEEREMSVAYGVDAVHSFLDDNKLDILCRAHQVCDGFMIPFEDDSSCISIFTASSEENGAGILQVGPKLECNFIVWNSNGENAAFQEENTNEEIEEEEESENVLVSAPDNEKN